MKLYDKNRSKVNNGFTLTEILIAVFAILVLATTIYVALSIIKNGAVDSNRVNDVNQMAKSLELYYDKNAYYPDVLDRLVSEGFLQSILLPAGASVGTYYKYVPLGENAICTGYHLGIALITKSNALTKDSDASPGVPCYGASSSDFDGTALNCQFGTLGRGKDKDNCYDLKI